MYTIADYFSILTNSRNSSPVGFLLNYFKEHEPLRSFAIDVVILTIHARNYSYVVAIVGYSVCVCNRVLHDVLIIVWFLFGLIFKSCCSEDIAGIRILAYQWRNWFWIERRVNSKCGSRRRSLSVSACEYSSHFKNTNPKRRKGDLDLNFSRTLRT